MTQRPGFAPRIQVIAVSPFHSIIKTQTGAMFQTVCSADGKPDIYNQREMYRVSTRLGEILATGGFLPKPNSNPLTLEGTYTHV